MSKSNPIYQPTGVNHEIKTIEQFAALVTEENLPFIIKDFKSVLEIVLNMNELSKVVCDQQGIPHERITIDTFNWIDDGLHEMSEVTIQAKDDPDFKVSFKA